MIESQMIKNDVHETPQEIHTRTFPFVSAILTISPRFASENIMKADLAGTGRPLAWYVDIVDDSEDPLVEFKPSTCDIDGASLK